MEGDLRGRYEETMARAQRLCRRSLAALEASLVSQLTARELRGRVEGYRRQRRAVQPGLDGDPGVDGDLAFEVRGIVDGVASVARWGPRSGLVCSPELRDRVEVVVAMGETFGGDGGAPLVVASLDDGPTSALLTVMRAFTRVTSVDTEGAAFSASPFGTTDPAAS